MTKLIHNVNVAKSVHQEVCPKQLFCFFQILTKYIINFWTKFVFNYGLCYEHLRKNNLSRLIF